MFGVIDHMSEWVPAFMLTFARISAMMVTLPIFGYPMVPVKVRGMISFVLALIIVPTIGSQSIPVIDSFLQLVLAVMKEVFIGLLIGFGARLIFEGFAVAGGFVGLQMGIAIVNVMDPTSRQQRPIVGQFWALVAITLLLITNGHYLLIETLTRNFSIIPLAGGHLTPALGNEFTKGISMAYEIGVRLAAPAMVFMLLVDAAIAFLARIMPQMNIFLVTLPLKIGVGVFVLITSLRIFEILFDYAYSDLGRYLYSIMGSIGKA